MQSDYSAPNTC